MFSGRPSFAILLSVLLLVGQWPLFVMAGSVPDGRQPHCHTQADGGYHDSADRMRNACHADQDPERCLQGCDCDLACTGCSVTLAAVLAERFRTDPSQATRPMTSLTGGLNSRLISPAERPPRPLLDRA